MLEVSKNVSSEAAGTGRKRAIVAFVPNKPIYVREHQILARTWRACCKEDTDLICIGPASIESQLDNDVIFLEHPDRTDAYRGYQFANSVDIFDSSLAPFLCSYTFLLKTDTDVFVTPAFRDLRSEGFMTGVGAYVNDEATKKNLQRVALANGLRHRGVHNVGSTWYGPAEQIVEVGRLTARLLRKLLDEEFREFAGEWPGWFRGVAALYASEIAANHLIDDIRRDGEQLDYSSTSDGSIEDHAHVHCWHTGDVFSKFAFQKGDYEGVDVEGLDTSIVRNYCLSMALR